LCALFLQADLVNRVENDLISIMQGVSVSILFVHVICEMLVICEMHCPITMKKMESNFVYLCTVWLADLYF
jgi:hypothetical protein